MNRARFDITQDELKQLKTLVNSNLDSFDSFDNLEFLKNLPVAAYQVPPRLVEFLNEFKYNPVEEGYCVISTGMVDDDKIGPTPAHWEFKTNNDTCRDAVMAMSLCSTVLGDIYGWLTQQDGRVVHDILPIKSCEKEQLGCGSKAELTLHVEDAFHELRGDYLIMMCLRNHEHTPTTLSKPDYRKLTKRQIDVLFEKHYTIKPDNSHKPKNSSSDRAKTLGSGELTHVEKAYGAMQKRVEQPEKIAVLFGNKKDPCLRLDPYFMETPDNPEATDALEALYEIVTASLVEVALNPGEILVVDNYEVVHGRRPFQARFDGADRWYKRINVIRDIRRCQEVLEHKLSRVIY